MIPSPQYRLRLDEWKRLCDASGLHGDVSAWHDRLLTAYAEKHRAYHNQEHLAECLSEFDNLRGFARQPDLVELALWFHDAVYDPRASDNEEKSAALAREFLRHFGRDTGEIMEVERLILVTKLHQPGKDPDAQIVIDADLAILGQPVERYFCYETAIAFEYAWVPAQTFREKRTEVLKRFLERPFLYYTTYSLQKYETQARENLNEAIARLRHPSP